MSYVPFCKINSYTNFHFCYFRRVVADDCAKYRILRTCRYYAVFRGITRNLAVLRGIRRYYAVFGSIRRYNAVSGGITQYLAVLRGIWRYQAVLRGIWRYLAVSGGIWRYLASIAQLPLTTRLTLLVSKILVSENVF